MANTTFRLKRSTVSGVTPTTGDISIGELAVNLRDRKLFTSNGSAVYELGSNLTNLAVSGNLTIGSSGDLVFTNGAGIEANGGFGTAGQLLTSNGTGVYWSTIPGVNTSAQYAWANVQTFNANIVVNSGLVANSSAGSAGQVLHSNGTSVYWAQANSGLSEVVTQQFTANGTANSFLVSGGYFPNAIEVYLAGVKQIPNVDVTLTSGSTVNFAVAPLNGQIVDVFGYKAANNLQSISAIVSQQFTANGTTNTFTITPGYIPNAIEVYVSGVKRVPVTDVDITSGSTITFTTAPLNGQIVDVFGYRSVGAVAPFVDTAGGTMTGNLRFNNTAVIVANGSFGTNGQVLTSNGTSMYWSSAGFTNGQSISVNNFVIAGAFTANGANGGAGQVLTSNGTGVYWSSAGVNTAAQYSWTNTHSFAANVTFNAAIVANSSAGTPGTVLTSNGSGVYWAAANAGISSVVAQQFTANGTANSFTVTGGYIPNAIEVYVTGVKKIPGTEVTITSGSTVNFVTPPLAGQIVDVFGYVSTGSISSYLALTGGTLSGNLTFTDGSVIVANGSFGSSGQVLTSNGTSMYWSSAGVNTAAQYSWTNTHSFSANVAFGNTITITHANNSSIVQSSGNATVNTVHISYTRLTGAGNPSSGMTRIVSNTSGRFTQIDATASRTAGSFVGTAFNDDNSTRAALAIAVASNTSGVPTGASLEINYSDDNTGTYPVIRGVTNSTSAFLTVGSGSVNTVINTTAVSTGNVILRSTGTLTLTAGAGLSANGGLGSVGQVLTSNGSSVYWAAAAAGVNTAAQYTWSNTHNFTNVVTFSTANAIILPVGNTASRPAASNGMIRYNTNTGLIEAVANTTWTGLMAAYSSVREQFTASNNQTTFTVTGGYIAGQIDVYYNGVKLRSGSEVNISSGTTVVLATGAANNALVEVVGIGPTFVVSNTAQIVYQQFTATNNQTTFTVSNGYVPGQVDVFADGIHLVNGVDVNVSSGSSIVLSTGVPNNTIVEVKGYSTPLVSAQSSTAVRQTFTANSTVNNNFTVTGGYIPGQVDVFYNGAKLVNGSDVNTSSGTTIVLTSNAVSNAIVDVVGINYFTAGGGVTTPVRQQFVATANQTTFTVTGGYTPGQIDVFRNGVKLTPGADVNISGGSTVVLVSPAANGDNIDVVGFAATSYQDSVRKSGDTMSGALVLGANLAVTGAATFSNTVVATGNVTTSGVFTDPTGTIRPLVQGTANTVSGVNVDYTGIPSWARRITISFSGFSTNGSSAPQIQLGTSGGFETTGYLGTNSITVASSVSVNFTTGFGIGVNTSNWSGATILHGAIVITNVTGNTWAAQGVTSSSASAATYYTSGSKALAGILDRIRVTTVNGTDAFDAGTINILFE